MIILHGGLIGEELHLWGEKPPRPAARKPRATRRAGGAGGPPEPLPFAASGEELLRAMAEAGLPRGRFRYRLRRVSGWLPSVAGVALPSGAVPSESSPSAGASRLLPWSLPALLLSAEEAVAFLLLCCDRPTLAPGVIIGAELSCLVDTLRFAGSLAARQRFLPGLRRWRGGYQACWDPVYGAQDRNTLLALARRLPAAVRALAEPQGRPAAGRTGLPPAAPALSARSLLEGFTGRLVDCLVRLRGYPDSLRLPPPPTRSAASFASLHDQWLHALQAADGGMGGEGLEGLLHQVEEWKRLLTLRESFPVRLCFRLEEPPESHPGGDPGARWYVRYLLQPREDLSLLLPVEEAWKARGGRPARSPAAKLVGLPHLSEYLLASLGQAAGLSREIEASLEEAHPSGYSLDSAGAHEFLTRTSLVLRQAGFGVLLPSWWTRQGTALRLRARARLGTPAMRGRSLLTMDSLVECSWEVALGEQALSLEELEALARLKQPLVRLRGQWVELGLQELQRAIQLWREQPRETMPVRQALQLALGSAPSMRGLEFAGVQATGRLQELRRLLEGEGRFEELPPPEGLRGSLRPYQLKGYSWLAFLSHWGLGACLADDMGLGKTVQVLALAQRRREEGARRPVLVVCPTSVVNNWRREAERFTPKLPLLVHHGAGRSKGSQFREQAEGSALVISTYALLHRDLEQLQEVSWGAAVLDEAQAIKNPQTRQARAAFALSAEYRIALTGTPVENNVGDLWSIMEFLNPGFLGSEADFRRRFFLPIQGWHDAEASKLLKRITAPFILRRLKTDRSVIADLPEKMELKVYCTLTREQASLYRAVLREAEEELATAEGMKRRGLILALLSRLKQICNHPAQFLREPAGNGAGRPERSGKLARLVEMLEEVAATGDRALVFTQFVGMGRIIRQQLQELTGREVLFLHGGVPKRQRDLMVERFQDQGQSPAVFVLSLKAGGTGLNLTRASHVFHFDRWWNPAVEDQATDRAFRIGQSRQVQVHKFICAGTLEEKIDEMIEAKKALSERVIGAGEAWLTELSNAELKEVFALRSEAVGR
jgi:SNF2 family DNA or RNA helicase